MLIAHINGAAPAREEPLQDHLELVRKYAAAFGAEFGAGALAGALGKVHDFGKGSEAFQRYIRSAGGECGEEGEDGEASGGAAAAASRRRGPDHSSAGAQFLDRELRGLGILLAYAAAGHHAGLPDGTANSHSSLANRLKKEIPEWEDSARRELPAGDFLVKDPGFGPEVRKFLSESDGYSAAFLVRMLFSCLVDADFLATEAFMDPGRAAARTLSPDCAPAALDRRLSAHYAALDARTAGAGLSGTPVNRVRNEVRADCLAAAESAPGLFTLTVPTGGGKTLASMAFALRHALRHGLRRVIYVIPYTSIIEQNAKVFRNVFGDDAVLEHHCNVDFERGGSRMKLLAENWDAPIVVTTGVQFFESLHANRTSRCRKLHNLASSVIILDEAQSLPVDLLRPCLRALEELTRNYGASVVLCTATQPAVLAGQLEKGGLTGAREIVAPGRNLHARLRRVEVARIPGKTADDELVERFAAFPSLLAVVGTRTHARELFLKAKGHFPPESVFHLSAQMCPRHRLDRLDTIRERLKNGLPCRVVSTQLIEAGVDIDFPCVFRELAGVDSLSQAAGRCNREGRLPGPGRVFLFESADFRPAPGFLTAAAQFGRETIGLAEFAADPLSPGATLRYFELLYADQAQTGARLDKFRVLSELIPAKLDPSRDGLLAFPFRTLGERFRLLDDHTFPVFVPYGEEGRELCERLRTTYALGERRRIARKLQRYAVSLHGTEPRDARGKLFAELVHGVYWVLTSPETNYDEDFGVSPEGKSIDPQI